jgi:hypothetical protein
MSKRLRLSERWFQRGLWLVALAFAGFLIGLGGKVVDNLSLTQAPITVAQFVDPVRGPQVERAIDGARQQVRHAEEQLAQARLAAAKASERYANEKDSFDNWVSTRRATARPDQDPQLIARNRQLDVLKLAVAAAQAAVQAQQQAELDATQSLSHLEEERTALYEPARVQAAAAARRAELHVFGYRLALTLPLLLVAAWLFVRKRASIYWPFVWGFIFFAGFAFFVELVPYLPSYGGYVRYGVGVVLTAVIGRYLILALQRYLARQRAAEALPKAARRDTVSYDTALARLERSICPGCERKVDLKDPKLDFCPHCGIGLFDHCGQCGTRKGAFARYCFACGTPAGHLNA